MKITSNRPYHAHQLGLDDPDGVIWGVFVGGCVDERNASSLWHNARSHAHNHTVDPWFGWLCVLDPSDVLTPKGSPTVILIHEIAHLMCPNTLHGAKWKRMVTKLGAPGEITRQGLSKLT